MRILGLVSPHLSSLLSFTVFAGCMYDATVLQIFKKRVTKYEVWFHLTNFPHPLPPSSSDQYTVQHIFTYTVLDSAQLFQYKPFITLGGCVFTVQVCSKLSKLFKIC